MKLYAKLLKLKKKLYSPLEWDREKTRGEEVDCWEEKGRIGIVAIDILIKK